LSREQCDGNEECAFHPYQAPFNFHGTKWDMEGMTQSRMDELGRALPVVRDAGGPMSPPPVGFKMPCLVPQNVALPQGKD
jgi:hypothetical protein